MENPVEEMGDFLLFKYRYRNQIMEDATGNASEELKNFYRF